MLGIRITQNDKLKLEFPNYEPYITEITN